MTELNLNELQSLWRSSPKALKLYLTACRKDKLMAFAHKQNLPIPHTYRKQFFIKAIESLVSRETPTSLGVHRKIGSAAMLGVIVCTLLSFQRFYTQIYITTLSCLGVYACARFSTAFSRNAATAAWYRAAAIFSALIIVVDVGVCWKTGFGIIGFLFKSIGI